MDHELDDYAFTQIGFQKSENRGRYCCC